MMWNLASIVVLLMLSVTKIVPAEASEFKRSDCDFHVLRSWSAEAERLQNKIDSLNFQMRWFIQSFNDANDDLEKSAYLSSDQIRQARFDRQTSAGMLKQLTADRKKAQWCLKFARRK